MILMMKYSSCSSLWSFKYFRTTSFMIMRKWCDITRNLDVESGICNRDSCLNSPPTQTCRSRCNFPYLIVWSQKWGRRQYQSCLFELKGCSEMWIKISYLFTLEQQDIRRVSGENTTISFVTNQNNNIYVSQYSVFLKQVLTKLLFKHNI